MMHYVVKYSGNLEEALLANANAGGENVARGALLGALFGAAYGVSAIPEHLKRGLSRCSQIESEIEAFVARYFKSAM